VKSPEVKPQAPNAEPTRAARILVVDDVEANVLVLSKMVKVLGHVPLSAPDGETAIVRARAEAPDLILMDVMMPGIDGIEATRRLKADPATRLIPIVVVTALTDADSRKRALEAGADDFVSKPVDSLELQFRVRALLAVKRTYDELEKARAGATEAERLKTEFLASVSHELRTPLTAISSAAKILVRYGVERPETVAKFAPVIVEQTNRMTRLLDGVLDLTRLEEGQGGWRDQSFPAEEVVLEAAEMFEPVTQEKGISLQVQVRPAGPGLGFVRGDRDRLTQVLVNLASNAVKFTSSGGTIRIASARVPPEEAVRWGVSPAAGRGAYLIAVEDNGIGIAPENHGLVFERFRQVTDVRHGKPQGTGLGLSICREIAERLGGRILLRSTPGKGSQFTVALPESEPPARAG
jgi:two-component system, sensor histidine kinase and response regulator